MNFHWFKNALAEPLKHSDVEPKIIIKLKNNFQLNTQMVINLMSASGSFLGFFLKVVCN